MGRGPASAWYKIWDGCEVMRHRQFAGRGLAVLCAHRHRLGFASLGNGIVRQGDRSHRGAAGLDLTVQGRGPRQPATANHGFERGAREGGQRAGGERVAGDRDGRWA
jgi:hypothetical protein